MTTMQTNDDITRTVSTDRYTNGDLSQAKCVMIWAQDMFARHYRQVRGGFVVQSFSRPDVKYNIIQDAVYGFGCGCPAHIKCKHLLILELIRVKPPRDIHTTPYKIGHVAIMEWMYDHGVDIPNAITTRDMLDKMRVENNLWKVQTLRARMSELMLDFEVRYVDRLEDNIPGATMPDEGYHYYLTQKGKNYIDILRTRNHAGPANHPDKEQGLGQAG